MTYKYSEDNLIEQPPTDLLFNQLHGVTILPLQ
jgi:hypothetical protein